MPISDWFSSDAEKHGNTPPATIDEKYASRVPSMDPHTLGLHMNLPRGTDLIGNKRAREFDARWSTEREMTDLTMPLRHTPHAMPLLPLGKLNGQMVGYNDDKMMVTLASARAGKTSGVLLPQLYTYPGSMIVFDPKGELAEDTAAHRRGVLGQDVHIIDGFGVTGLPTSSLNVLDMIDLDSIRVVDDAYNMAQAIVTHDGGSDGGFWTEGGRDLVAGVLLSVKQLSKAHQHLLTARQLITGAHPRMRAQLQGKKFKNQREEVEFAERLLFSEMAKDAHTNKALSFIIQGIGQTYANMPDRLRGSMLATARGATRFLDSLAIQRVVQESKFQWADLRTKRQPTTVYLVLPAGNEVQAHYRWLRLMYETAAASLSRLGKYPRDKPPIIFMMEEFPVAGNLPLMNQAANYLPGFGIKLHIVAQNLSQIQQHYPNSWRDFLSSAGCVQCFSNGDDITLGYIEEWLGQTMVDREPAQYSHQGEDQRIAYPLASKAEIRRLFARKYEDQIIMIPGDHPYAFTRLDIDDVEALRRNMASSNQMSLEGADELRAQRRLRGGGGKVISEGGLQMLPTAPVKPKQPRS